MVSLIHQRHSVGLLRKSHQLLSHLENHDTIIKYRFSSELLLSSRSNRTVTNDIVTNYTAKFVS